MALMLLAALVAAPNAKAVEADLEVGTSENAVFIEPDFTGTEILIFGAIDQPRQPAPRAEPYDIVVTIRGPTQPRTVWRKDRVMGIWVNDDEVTFPTAPSFFLVLSTNSPADIAPEWERERYELSLADLALEPAEEARERHTPEELEAFREALLRLKTQRGLYGEKVPGVEFLGHRLFRARAEIPASVPTGLYRASVYLIRDNRVVSRSTSFIRLQKVGIERFLSATAVEQPLLYGLGSVLLAVAIGGIGSFIGRR